MNLSEALLTLTFRRSVFQAVGKKKIFYSSLNDIGRREEPFIMDNTNECPVYAFPNHSELTAYISKP